MMWKRLAILLTVLFMAIFAFLTWYKFHYSMEHVYSFEINSPDNKVRVLIASQGSKFKNAIVDGITKHLRQRQAYIKVMDVSELPQIDEKQWNAIIILHTWENWKPQKEAKIFLEQEAKDRGKLIILTTSGEGNRKIDGINAISSASVMSQVPDHIQEINRRLDAILNQQSSSGAN